MSEGKILPTTALSSEDQARAETYHLLGLLLARAPDPALLDYLRQLYKEIVPTTPAFTTALSQLAKAAESSEVSYLEEEYFKLFIGLGRGELLPYGSAYLTGFLMEKPLARLRTVLSQLGFTRQEQVSEPEDHVAALCEVMGMIISENVLSFNEQDQFFKEFISPWMGRFFQELTKTESADFYKAVGQLGLVFIDIETQYFSMPE